MSKTISIKQGTTFACSAQWTPGDDGPANLIGTTIASSVEDACGNVYPLTVSIAIDGLSFTMLYPGSTASWADGLGKWDIKFTYPTGSTFSDTLRVKVMPPVTV